MGKKFCKWCNLEAEDVYPCYLCGALYCKDHMSHLADPLSEGNLYLPEDFSWDQLIHFINSLSFNFPRPDASLHFYGTYKHFYERVYTKVDSDIFLLPHLCKDCTAKHLQRIEKEFFPVVRSVKEAGLICYHSICPIDAEWKCDFCSKCFCSCHSLHECSKCHKILCESESCINAHYYQCHKRKWWFL
jgi:hypothetical protein